MNSRAKGASFELLVAKMILKAAGLDKKHCYRTPLSGGHAQYSKDMPGDLFISDDLFDLFPFVVEAKHNKTWKPGVMLYPRKQEQAWMAQVTRDTARAWSSGRPDASPFLVMRGNGTEIFAATPYFSETALWDATPYLVYTWKGDVWIMVSFSTALHELEKRVAARVKGGLTRK